MFALVFALVSALVFALVFAQADERNSRRLECEYVASCSVAEVAA